MKLSPKNKFLVILATGVLLLILSFPLAINRTLEVRDTYRQLRAQSNFTKELPRQLALLEQKDKYYDSILSKHDMGSNSVQNNLIQFISVQSTAQQVEIVEFKKPHIIKYQDHQASTYQFRLKGSYSALVKTIYNLEQNGNFGEVIHINFEKKKNYKTRKERLEATVFVQQLK